MHLCMHACGMHGDGIVLTGFSSTNDQCNCRPKTVRLDYIGCDGIICHVPATQTKLTKPD